MLVLTRKSNQSIMINNDIEVTVVEIKGGTVKIGITAPRNVQVYRKEIFEEILKENLSAAVSEKDKLSKISTLLSSKMIRKTEQDMTKPKEGGNDERKDKNE